LPCRVKGLLPTLSGPSPRTPLPLSQDFYLSHTPSPKGSPPMAARREPPARPSDLPRLSTRIKLVVRSLDSLRVKASVLPGERGWGYLAAALAAGSVSVRQWRTDFSRSNVEAPAYPFPPFRGSARLFSQGLPPPLEPPLWQWARMWPGCRPIREGTNFDWEALSGLGTG